MYIYIYTYICVQQSAADDEIYGYYQQRMAGGEGEGSEVEGSSGGGGGGGGVFGGFNFGDQGDKTQQADDDDGDENTLSVEEYNKRRSSGAGRERRAQVSSEVVDVDASDFELKVYCVYCVLCVLCVLCDV